MELWLGALNLGLLYSFLAVGAFVSFRVLDFPDVTPDGSFTLGACLAGILLVKGADPWAAAAAGLAGGLVAGAATGFVHVRLKVQGLLAGILVMTALYSVNLLSLGRSNVPLLSTPTVFAPLARLLPSWHAELRALALLLPLALVFWLLASLASLTHAGLSLRAVGACPSMAEAGGVNVELWKVGGLALANGLAGLSGALVAQYQGFADVGMGVGIVVLGMASVILGEALVRSRRMPVRILGALLGAVLFRYLVAAALAAGFDPNALKLLTAAFVLGALLAGQKLQGLTGWLTPRRLAAAGALLLVAGGAVWGVRQLRARPRGPKVAIVLFADAVFMEEARDALVGELARLGWPAPEKVQLLVRSAQGDHSSLPTIMDSLVQERVDLVVAVGTPTTQAALARVKEIPIVFTAVSSPALAGAGDSDTSHPPNVTGCYGRAPVAGLLDLVQRLVPGVSRVGAAWDPSSAISSADMALLEKLAGERKLEFVGATVNTTADVGLAVQSLAQRGAQAFLVTDTLVYSAFDQLIGVCRSARIPLFTMDPTRLDRGALAFNGCSFTEAGILTARVVDRVLRGEKPAAIPYQPYPMTYLGFNAEVARTLGLTIPPDLLDRAARSDEARARLAANLRTGSRVRRVAVFTFSENTIFDDSLRGFRSALAPRVAAGDLVLDERCAQGSHADANAIAQALSRGDHAVLSTIGSLALQAQVQFNTKVPHVFGVVTDPYAAGAAKGPEQHPPHLTGLQTLQPVGSVLKLMRELYPGARRIGLVRNPSEVNSEVCAKAALREGAALGFVFEETHVFTTAEVRTAVDALLARDVELLLTAGDSTVSAVIGDVARRGRERRVPLFSTTPAETRLGVLCAVGADYEEVGRETGKLLLRVLDGEPPARIPIRSFVPEKLAFNLRAAREVGLVLPRGLLQRASYTVEGP